MINQIVKVMETSDSADTLLSKIDRLIEPVAEEMGFELVDTEYLCENGRWVLRVYLDKEGGITIDDCATSSREIGGLIDIKEVFDHGYVLEVSSPGLNRRLRREKDFMDVLDKMVKITMSKPLDGRRNFKGRLSRVQDGILHIVIENEIVEIPLQGVKKANLIYEFGS